MQPTPNNPKGAAMKLSLISIIIPFFLIPLACGTDKRDELTNEALANYKEATQKLYIKCGESWYFKITVGNRSGFFEVKGLNYSIQTLDLSETDKLNGIQCRVDVGIGISSIRRYLNGSWNAWESGGFIPTVKIDRKWEMRMVEGIWYIRDYRQYRETFIPIENWLYARDTISLYDLEKADFTCADVPR